LEKPVDEEAMLAAVRTALAASARQCGQRTERDERARRLAALSPRERDVLDGLVKGESNKAVAQRLGISPRTVEVYRANLMIKLQAGGLSDLVRIALTVGEEN
jgi:two-component system response regulator FixJ